MGEFRGDTDDLEYFTTAGATFRNSLAAILSEVQSSRGLVRSALSVADTPRPADGPFGNLLVDVDATHRFTDSVHDTLVEQTGTGSGGSGPLSWLTSAGSFVADHGGDLLSSGIGVVVDPLDPLDDLAVDTVPFLATVPEAFGKTIFGAAYPAVADGINRHVTPHVVSRVWRDLDAFLPDHRVDGDPGGTFSRRSTGARLLDRDHLGIDVGRRAVMSALDDTADGRRIHQDEFEIIRHGARTYTIVLPGVVDLTGPTSGLDPRHGSPRDTDEVAVWSASSSFLADNLYGRLVAESLDRNHVPPGADLMIVGHSFGADTALDLAADERFNGELFNVTHVVAAGYHSEPQLADVSPGTRVLVLQNNKDVPVLVENIAHISHDPLEEFKTPRSGVIVREFDGGWRGLGHHQANYTAYLGAGQPDPEVDAFFSTVSGLGYGDPGLADAIDISSPYAG